MPNKLIIAIKQTGRFINLPSIRLYTYIIIFNYLLQYIITKQYFKDFVNFSLKKFVGVGKVSIHINPITQEVYMANALAAPQAPVAVSYFPEVPPVAQGDTYRAIIDGARAEYNGHYEVYNAEADRIAPLVQEWGEKHVHILAGTAEPMPTADEQQADLNRKVDRYIELRKVRDDTIKIRGLYDQAILKCTPPELDRDTITVLLRMKVKVADLKVAYDSMFTTDVNQLKDQRDKIDILAKRIIPALVTLATTVENYAFHVQGYTNSALSISAYQAQKVLMGSTAPLLKGMVVAREKVIADLVAPVPAQ